MLGWFRLVIKMLWDARLPPRGDDGGDSDRIMGMVCPVLNASVCVSSSSGDRHLTPSCEELGEVCLHDDRLWSTRAPPEELMVSSATGVWGCCAYMLTGCRS